MQVAQRSLLAYPRQQEARADRAGDRLPRRRTGQSRAGLLATLKRLANEILLSSSIGRPLPPEPPLPSERVIALETLVDKGPFRDRKDPPELQRRHDLVRAKLSPSPGRPTGSRRAIP